ncbi:MAG: replication-associated recombination protein A, partial [Terracidiphilus sp.]
MSLFDVPLNSSKGVPRTAALHSMVPLAERMRPRSLDELVGQEHLVGPGKPLRVQIERDDATSMIFWGPPGVGKTTLAKIIAESTKATFIEFSAVTSGIKEIKQVMADAAKAAEMSSRTILFVDEIHRFNKAQQDAFLPYVERGTIRLIGATTENPSFEIISALLSRCRVYVLEPLKDEQIALLLKRALADRDRGLGALELAADDDALELIASYSSGDCRSAYNTLEVAAQLAQEEKKITKAVAAEAAQRRVLQYDKAGEEHFNLISALHKSVRNSDPDAALYWLGRMLAGGEDPLYLARRIVRMAIEDIGLAAPEALNLCLSAKDTYDFLGSPEGELALAEAVVYLALAPKSNAVYVAYGAVKGDIEHTRQEPVPLHLRNAPTKLMKELGYSEGYRYAHDEEGKVADMDCLPESLRGRRYYQP